MLLLSFCRAGYDTDHYNNLCKFKKVTLSSGQGEENATDNNLADYGCDQQCTRVLVGEGGKAELMIDLGYVMDLSTIVFIGASGENTPHYGNMERYYGTSTNYHTNTLIQQDGGQNYPSMVADINDGGPQSVRYIHWISDSPFFVNEIQCYEKKRLLDSDLQTAKTYVPVANGPIGYSGSWCQQESSDIANIRYTSDRTIWRIAVLTEAGLIDTANDYKDFKMTEDGGGNQKQCSQDSNDWGMDCHKETSNTGGFPHREMKVEIDGSTQDMERTICLMLLIEDGNGVQASPTATEPLTAATTHRQLCSSCSWPIYIGDGNQGAVEVQSMDVNSAETSIVVGVSSTDTTLTGPATHAVQMYTVATQEQQWMRTLPDSTGSAFVYFADSDSKVLLAFSSDTGSGSRYTLVFMDASSGNTIGAFHQQDRSGAKLQHASLAIKSDASEVYICSNFPEQNQNSMTKLGFDGANWSNQLQYTWAPSQLTAGKYLQKNSAVMAPDENYVISLSTSEDDSKHEDCTALLWKTDSLTPERKKNNHYGVLRNCRFPRVHFHSNLHYVLTVAEYMDAEDNNYAFFRTGFIRHTFQDNYGDFTDDGNTMYYVTDKRLAVTGVYCPNYEEWYLTATDSQNYLVTYKWADQRAKYYTLNSHNTLHLHGHITGTSTTGLPVTGYYAGGTTQTTTNSGCTNNFSNMVGHISKIQLDGDSCLTESVTPTLSVQTDDAKDDGQGIKCHASLDYQVYAGFLSNVVGYSLENLQLSSPFCTILGGLPSHDSSKSYTVNGVEDSLEVGALSEQPSGCMVTYVTTISPAANFMTPLASGRGMKWYTTSESDVGSYTITVTATSGSLTESTTYSVEVLSQYCSSLTAPAHAEYKLYIVGRYRGKEVVGIFPALPEGCLVSYAVAVDPPAQFFTQLPSKRGMKWETQSEADIGLYTVTVTATSGSVVETTSYDVEVISQYCYSLIPPSHATEKSYIVDSAEDQLEIGLFTESPTSCPITYDTTVYPEANFMTKLESGRGMKWQTSLQGDIGTYEVTVTATSNDFSESTTYIVRVVLDGEPNPPNWDTDRVRILSPTDSDCQARVDEVWQKMNGACQWGQWSDDRYALMFKPGVHSCNVNVGWYTTVIGLGDSPTDTVLASLQSTDPQNCGNSLYNIWKSVENVEFGHNQPNVPWYVSQGAPMRRVKCVSDITLGYGDSSGGFMSNTEVTGTIYAETQQQFFFRNTNMGSFVKGFWNFVFLGCQGAPETHCGQSDDGIPATTIDQTPLIAEKPYITIDSSDKFYLKRPKYKTASQGTDWADGADVIDFSEVYVASDTDSAAIINGKLAEGLHVVLQPGNYNLDDSLKITVDGQVLLGLGMATLTPTNGNACIEVADGVDARIAGLLLQASTNQSEQLLKWGTDTTKGSAETPGVISDVFIRVGGTTNSYTEEVSAQKMMEINNQHVIIDHTWLWRADHDVAGPVYSRRNFVENGLQVNADNVKAYGLFSEHSLGDLVQWNGNNGEVYLYQSLLPRDVTQADFADAGYVGFKVADQVTSFKGYGIAVYSYFRDNTVWQPSAIMAPAEVPGIEFTNSYIRFIYGNGGISNVINDQGSSVGSGYPDSYLCDFDTTPQCTSLTAPDFAATKSYTVNDIEDQQEIGTFTEIPSGCPVSYESTVSPTAEFMTQLESGRGMKWSTSNEGNVGTYTVRVTATSKDFSEFVEYTVEISSQYCSDLVAPTHDASKSYLVNSAEDFMEIGTFTEIPTGCPVTYETTVSKTAEFMTQLESGRGMMWSTSNEGDVGTYTVRVTARSGDIIEFVEYSVEIQSQYCTDLVAPNHDASKSYVVNGAEDSLEIGVFSETPTGCPVTYETTVSPEATFMTQLASGRGMKWQTASEDDVMTYEVTITATSGDYSEFTTYLVDVLSQHCATLTAPSHDAYRTYTVNDEEDLLEVGAFAKLPTDCLVTYETSVSPDAPFMTALSSGRGMKWSTSQESHVGTYEVTVTATSGDYSEFSTYLVEILSQHCAVLTAPFHDAYRTYTVNSQEDQLEVGAFAKLPTGCLVTYETSVSPTADFMTPLASGRGMKWVTASEGNVGTYEVTVTATSDDYSEFTTYIVEILSQHCAVLTAPFHDAYRAYTVNDEEDQLEVGAFAKLPTDCLVTYATTVSPDAPFMTALSSGRGMKWSTAQESYVGTYQVTVTATSGDYSEFTTYVVDILSAHCAVLTAPYHKAYKTYVVNGVEDQLEVPAFTGFPSGCQPTYSTTVSPTAEFMTPLASGRGMRWQTALESDVNTYQVTITATSDDISESTTYTVNVLSAHCTTLTAPYHNAYRTYKINDPEDQLQVGAFVGLPTGCLITYATTVSPDAPFMTALSSGRGMKWSTAQESYVGTYQVTVTATSDELSVSTTYVLDVLSQHCEILTAPFHVAYKTYKVNGEEDQLEVGQFAALPSDCSPTYETTVSPTADFMTPLASGRGMKWQTATEADVGIYIVTVTATSDDLSESTTYTVEILSQYCTSLEAPTHVSSKIYIVGDAEDNVEVGLFTEVPTNCPVTYETSVSPAASFMTVLSTKRGMKWSTTNEAHVGLYTITVTAISGSLQESTTYTVDIETNVCSTNSITWRTLNSDVTFTILQQSKIPISPHSVTQSNASKCTLGSIVLQVQDTGTGEWLDYQTMPNQPAWIQHFDGFSQSFDIYTSDPTLDSQVVALRYAISDDGTPVNTAYDTFTVTIDYLCNHVVLEADALDDMIHDIGTGQHHQSIVVRSMIPEQGETDQCGQYLYELVSAPSYLSLSGSTLQVESGILEEQQVQPQETVTLKISLAVKPTTQVIIEFEVGLTCSEDCVAQLCGQTSFQIEDSLDMRLEIGTGSDSKELAIKDTISSQRGNSDGLTFCGERTYELVNSQSWLTLVGSTLTISSDSVEDAQEIVDAQIIVTLVMDDSVSTTIDFTATLYSDDPKITDRTDCNSVTVERPDRLEDMHIAYGSDLKVVQRIDTLKDSQGNEVADECYPEYEIEYLSLHTYLKLNTRADRIVLRTPSVRQESLISYNTQEEATLVIKEKESGKTLFRQSFQVCITPPVCKHLHIVHTDVYNIYGNIFENMRIQMLPEDSSETKLTSEQALPPLTDAFEVLQSGRCSEAYYQPFVEGVIVDWLEINGDKLIIKSPDDTSLAGNHVVEVRLLYPASLDQKESRLLQESSETSLNDQEDVQVDRDPYNDHILDSNYFTATVEVVTEFSSIEPEAKVELGYKGIGGVFLPPWIVEPGSRFKYKLPSLINDDNVDVEVEAARLDSRLEDCDCFFFRRNRNEITLDVPEDWLLDDENAETFAIHLSHEGEHKIFYVPVLIILDPDETTRINWRQGLGIRVNKKLDMVQQAIWADTPFYQEAENEINLSTTRRDVDPETCVPIYAKTTSNGIIEVTFNHRFDLLVTDEELEDMLYQGAIQIQLVTAMEPENGFPDFTWEVEKTNDNTLTFSINWSDPTMISSMGSDRDSLRIFLDDLSDIIQCYVEGTQTEEFRRLMESELIPVQSTVIRLEIPPQKSVEGLEQKLVDIDVVQATEVLLFGIGLSSVLAVPSQVLYDSILSSQIISHIPLNNVNLPQVSMAFMQSLNKLVSFNSKEPYGFLGVEFSVTPPVNASFDWMGYGSMNFLENIGLISFIFIFIVVRQVLGLVFFLIGKNLERARCLRAKPKVLASAGYVCSNMWLRFLLMTYFELVIACFVGANIEPFLPQTLLTSDKVSLVTQQVANGIIMFFLLVVITAIWLKTRQKQEILEQSSFHQSRQKQGQEVAGSDMPSCSSIQTDPGANKHQSFADKNDPYQENRELEVHRQPFSAQELMAENIGSFDIGDSETKRRESFRSQSSSHIETPNATPLGVDSNRAFQPYENNQDFSASVDQFASQDTINIGNIHYQKLNQRCALPQGRVLMPQRLSSGPSSALS